MKNLINPVSLLAGLFLTLTGSWSCTSETEKDLSLAFNPNNSPYYFMAYFVNSSHDTTGRYKMELTIVSEKSNVEGENGNYSISFNSSDKTYKTRWKITSLGLPPDTIMYEGNLNKDGHMVTLEMPQSGIFSPLSHTLDISASAKDEAGKVYKTNFSGIRKPGEGMQQITADRKVNKIEEQNWNGKKIKTWHYEATTQHGEIITKENYIYSPEVGIISITYYLPGNEKIYIEQRPK